jgi:uncharacterized protein YqgV (UPF0045/DUF77 family)
MTVSVEVSYYPLREEYVDPIRDFIHRINQYQDLKCRTNGMSTQVFGDYDYVMEAITREIKTSFALPHSVFIMKVINAGLDNREQE